VSGTPLMQQYREVKQRFPNAQGGYLVWEGEESGGRRWQQDRPGGSEPGLQRCSRCMNCMQCSARPCNAVQCRRERPVATCNVQ
jgi:hypothetical protein